MSGPTNPFQRPDLIHLENGALYEEIAEQFASLWEYLVAHVPPGRYLSLALTELEKAGHFAQDAADAADADEIRKRNRFLYPEEGDAPAAEARRRIDERKVKR